MQNLMIVATRENQVYCMSGRELILQKVREVAIVAEGLPTARFVVVGNGDKRGRLEGLCAELGLTDRVVFLGRCSDVYV